MPVIICGVCRRSISGAEIALDFGADARGRLFLSGLCSRCYHAPEHAGESLFDREIAPADPDAPPAVPEHVEQQWGG